MPERKRKRSRKSIPPEITRFLDAVNAASIINHPNIRWETDPQAWSREFLAAYVWRNMYDALHYAPHGWKVPPRLKAEFPDFPWDDPNRPDIYEIVSLAAKPRNETFAASVASPPAGPPAVCDMSATPESWDDARELALAWLKETGLDRDLAYCWICRRFFLVKDDRQVYCGDACRWKASNASSPERVRRNRENRQTKRALEGAKLRAKKRRLVELRAQRLGTRKMSKSTE